MHANIRLDPNWQFDQWDFATDDQDNWEQVLGVGLLFVTPWICQNIIKKLEVVYPRAFACYHLDGLQSSFAYGGPNNMTLGISALIPISIINQTLWTVQQPAKKHSKIFLGHFNLKKDISDGIEKYFLRIRMT